MLGILAADVAKVDPVLVELEGAPEAMGLVGLVSGDAFGVLVVEVLGVLVGVTLVG